MHDQLVKPAPIIFLEKRLLKVVRQFFKECLGMCTSRTYLGGSGTGMYITAVAALPLDFLLLGKNPAFAHIFSQLEVCLLYTSPLETAVREKIPGVG